MPQGDVTCSKLDCASASVGTVFGVFADVQQVIKRDDGHVADAIVFGGGLGSIVGAENVLGHNDGDG